MAQPSRVRSLQLQPRFNASLELLPPGEGAMVPARRIEVEATARCDVVVREMAEGS